MVEIRANTKVIVFDLGLPVMRPTEVSLMLKSARLAADNPLALKEPSQPPPFSMPSKFSIMHGEVKSECFTVGCVPKRTFNHLK